MYMEKSTEKDKIEDYEQLFLNAWNYLLFSS